MMMLMMMTVSYFFETESHVANTGLELLIILLLSPRYWDYSHMLLHPVSTHWFLSICMKFFYFLEPEVRNTAVKTIYPLLDN